MSEIAEALRYLADHERPSGGQQRFNAEHLYQLADEADGVKSAKPGLAPLTIHQIRGKMMERQHQIAAVRHTLEAVIHDSQLLLRQLEQEQIQWEEAVELSLQESERTIAARRAASDKA
jgi:hypothetical protein